MSQINQVNQTNQISHHRQWLHTKFPNGPVKANSDLCAHRTHNSLRGLRVWSKAQLGGTVVIHGADDIFVVQWDNGLVAMHGKDELFRSAVLIDAHDNLKNYLDYMRHHTCTP